MTVSEIATVLAWHDALNDDDVETLVRLSGDDIDIGGAHGAIQGHAALREWAGSSTISAVPGKMYVHDGVVVVAERDGSGAAFRVVHDHVTSLFRHDTLAAALAATELTEADLFEG